MRPSLLVLAWLATTLSVDGPHVVAVHFAFTAMHGPFLLEKIMAAHISLKYS